jgi:hypothetical protein
MSAPETGYAQSATGRVGYQIVGAGPPDVLVTKPTYLPIDLMRDEPRIVRFLDGLSSFSRHIWFDNDWQLFVVEDLPRGGSGPADRTA